MNAEQVNNVGLGKMDAAARERMIGIICGFLVILFFSSFILVSRLGFTSSLTVPDIAAFRFGISGLILLPVFLKYRLCGLRFRQAVLLAFMGGLGFALFAYAGFLLAPAAHGAVLLHGTVPLFTFVITMLVIGMKASRAKIFGVLMITLGVLMMALDSLLGATLRQLLGDLCLLMASVCWAGYGIYARRLSLPPIRTASIVAVFSMTCFLPVYLFVPGKAIFDVGLNEVLLQAVFQGFLIGVVSLFNYTRAVSALGASETALFTAAVPIVTTLGAVPLLGEIPSVAGMLGVVVVTAGMVVSMRRS
jgi:drug/metabolite transporter (DMT)-like permease